VLTDCRGLDALEAVGDLSIQNNASLASLQGLEQLGQANVVAIHGNSALRRIDALESLTSVRDFITIARNPLLPSCQAELLLDRLSTPKVYVFDNDGDAGCP
jgi:hypothetical protein